MFNTFIDYWYYTGDDRYNLIITEGLEHQIGEPNAFLPPNQTGSRDHSEQQLAGPRSTMLSAFTNKLQTEQQFLKQWRREGPLGILIAIINYIKTPQQYALFADFQRAAADYIPEESQQKILEPVKPVVTRWNSFYCVFHPSDSTGVVLSKCTAATASSFVRVFGSPDDMRRARVRCMIVLPAAYWRPFCSSVFSAVVSTLMLMFSAVVSTLMLTVLQPSAKSRPSPFSLSDLTIITKYL
jgi:hypothetical protein